MFFYMMVAVSYTKKARSLYRQKALTVVVTAYKNGSRDIFARIAASNLKMVIMISFLRYNLLFYHLFFCL